MFIYYIGKKSECIRTLGLHSVAPRYYLAEVLGGTKWNTLVHLGSPQTRAQ